MLVFTLICLRCVLTLASTLDLTLIRSSYLSPGVYYPCTYLPRTIPARALKLTPFGRYVVQIVIMNLPGLAVDLQLPSVLTEDNNVSTRVVRPTNQGLWPRLGCVLTGIDEFGEFAAS